MQVLLSGRLIEVRAVTEQTLLLAISLEIVVKLGTSEQVQASRREHSSSFTGGLLHGTTLIGI